VCRPKHVEQLRNTGIINSTTRSHLVGSFYEIYCLLYCGKYRDNTLELTIIVFSDSYNYSLPLHKENMKTFCATPLLTLHI